ncbi:MAG: Sec-independent protein translocase protein TatB [Thiobacillaceae bacterium]
MFDIAFSELLVIGIVALIVIGPERLPKVARTAGQWLGRLNRYVAQVKQDIDRDMKLEELRKLQQEMKETAQRYEILADETRREIEQEADQVKRVVAAMSATDDGLTKKAYEELMAEQSDKAMTAAADEPTALPHTPGGEIPGQPAVATTPDKQDRPG